ncbi:SDR family oxidoreductase [Terrarubrum flagellatum]|uniref:SDR family oxidoreductase n=1 Tax=Terrirubrum flagellatum TaxID=2895980 RepID=UPI003144D520
MDLGIKGRKAIICASSRGLGRACAMELAAAGCEVVINGRDEKITNATADAIRAETGAKVTVVLGDVSTKVTQDALLAACPAPDILINNNGGPPPKGFRELDRSAIAEGVVQNMVTPIELIQRVVDGMVARGFGRIVNITSSSVKAPIIGLDLSSGARAGLTAFLAAPAREVAHANVTINSMLPGVFDTDRQKTATKRMAAIKGVSEDEIVATRMKDVPAGRLGTPDEFGKLCAFLCSAHAGYITGQNLLIDGGAIKTAF